MVVDLPSDGCNILQSSDLLYNYSDNNQNRREYVIYENTLVLRGTTSSSYGFTHNGTCISSLIYKPELKVWFPIISFVIFFGIVIFVFRLFRGRI